MPTVPAIGRYAVAPIWKRPRAGSILQSQLLLGEPVRVLEAVDAFSRVAYDRGRGEGYVRTDQLVTVDESLYKEQEQNPALVLEPYGHLLSDVRGVPVTFGARLPRFDGLQTQLGAERFRFSGQAVFPGHQAIDAALLLRLGRKWLYVPEQASGRTPVGVGAVELVQLLYALTGTDLPRNLTAMLGEGRTVDFVEQCQPGDLAFFDGGRGGLSHVGILMPGSEVLHVDGRVRVDAIDHFGIFDREAGCYTHRLRIVRRLLPDVPPGEAMRLEDKISVARPDPQQMAIF